MDREERGFLFKTMEWFMSKILTVRYSECSPSICGVWPRRIAINFPFFSGISHHLNVFWSTTAGRSQLLWGWQCLCGGPRRARGRLWGGKDAVILHLLPPLHCYCLHPLHTRHQQMFSAGGWGVANFFFFYYNSENSNCSNGWKVDLVGFCGTLCSNFLIYKVVHSWNECYQ